MKIYPICERSFNTWLTSNIDREIYYYRIGSPKPFQNHDFEKFEISLLDNFTIEKDKDNKLSKYLLNIVCDTMNNKLILEKLLELSKSKIDVISLVDLNGTFTEEDLEDVLYKLKKERFPFSKLSLKLVPTNNILNIIYLALSYGVIRFDLENLDESIYYKSLAIYIANKIASY
jgi:hypothetical protein